MPGAIIPDDWDGSTFVCNRIMWPASEQWRALLLGSATNPARVDYWDEDSGDPSDAMQAVEDAFDLTVPTIYTTGCDEMIPGIPVPTFKVSKDTGQALSAATWTPIDWDVLSWNLNSPQFVLPFSKQAITVENNFGVWHYTLNIGIDSATQMFIQAIITPGPINLALTGTTNGFAELNFDYIWDGSDVALTVEVWSLVAANLDIQIKNCHWSGFLVGPTSE